MKICIVSDSHDNRRLLVAAVSDAKACGAQIVLHCGDLVAPSTLPALQPLGLPIHVIHGNNAGDLVVLMRMANRRPDFIHYYGQDAELSLAGRRLFLVHFPNYARGMAATGDYDLVCCGHSHEASIEQQANVKGGRTLLINPGTVAGVDAPPTYAFGDLRTLAFSIRSVPHAGA
nr:metallophosphoesterase family protein [Gammaproteobacteria bacterium]